jgi:hypothetical protein
MTLLSPGRFLTHLVATMIGLCTLVLVVNTIADPYRLLHTPPIQGWTNAKPDSFKNSREFKAIQIRWLEAERVVLGNSRADIGIKPTTPVFAGESTAFNLALPAADMTEHLNSFKLALQSQPGIDRVLLGVDLVAFRPRADTSKDQDTAGPADEGKRSAAWLLLENLMSSSTLASSVKTIIYSVTGRTVRESYDEHGHLNRINPPGMSTALAFESHLRDVYLGGWYRDLRLSEAQLAALAELASICRERHIDLRVFISPVHAAQWEAIRNSGLEHTLEEWKRRLVKITPVWDFSGYNEVSGEPLAQRMSHYLDSSHYLPHVGDMILRRLYEKSPSDLAEGFGQLMTAENVEAQIERFRVERERWARSRPDEVRQYEAWARSSQ